MNMRLALKLMRFWPPYLGAGIRVAHVNEDITSVTVEMRLRFYNNNYVGTHFGGSLYAMADPFYMLMLIHNLGRGYIVWDKASTIRFKRPGKGCVSATYEIPHARIAEIRAAADAGPKVEPVFTARITDEAGETVAEVEKLLYVRKKT